MVAVSGALHSHDDVCPGRSCNVFVSQLEGPKPVSNVTVFHSQLQISSESSLRIERFRKIFTIDLF